jgi:molybdopterin adenylyltransferase
MGLVTKIGVVTVSDRASRGEYQDRGGPAVVEYLNATVTSEVQLTSLVIADECGLIEATLVELSDVENCDLIITTGGTGPAIRDVTPEATESVCDKMMPGFGELMRQVSLTKVPTAILSRQVAGIRSSETGGTLIINLPGSPKAIAECLDAVFAAVPYCVDLIGGGFLETNPDRIVAFRPKSK